MMRKATVSQGLPPSRPYHYRREDEALNTRSRNQRIDIENYRLPPEYAPRRVPQYQRPDQLHYRDSRPRNQYGVRKVTRGQPVPQEIAQQYKGQRHRKPQPAFRSRKHKGGKRKMEVADATVASEERVSEEQVKVTQVVVVEETTSTVEVEVEENARDSSPARLIHRKSKSLSPGKKTTSPKKAKTPERRAKTPDRKAKTPEKNSKSPEKRAKSPEKRAKSPERKTKSPERKAKSPERKAKSPDRKPKSPERKSLKKSPRVKPVEEKGDLEIVENGSEEDVPLAVELRESRSSLLGNRSMRLRLSDIGHKSEIPKVAEPEPEEEEEEVEAEEEGLHLSNSSTMSFSSLPPARNTSKESGELSASTSSPNHDQSPSREPTLGLSLRSISARRPLRGASSFASPVSSPMSFSSVTSPQATAESPRRYLDRKAKSSEKLNRSELAKPREEPAEPREEPAQPHDEPAKHREAEMLDMSADETGILAEESTKDGSRKKRKSRTSGAGQELKKLKAQPSDEVSTPMKTPCVEEMKTPPSRSSFLSLVTSPFFLFRRARSNSSFHETAEKAMEVDVQVECSPEKTVLREDSDADVEVVDVEETSLPNDKEHPAIAEAEPAPERNWCSVM